MVGKSIGHYTIEEKIGEGGMGEVYRATDSLLKRDVALKFLPESMAQDEIARRRFLREARSAAALDHPYICQIHEIGEIDGVDFIVMEFVSGRTLREKLSQGRLPVPECLRLAAEIAEALDNAQEKGIVHRDLKPSNIMLTSGGHVKLMDFGLAKRASSGAQEDTQQVSVTKLTQQGSTLGTVPYMSPEQLKGEEIDSRSDIFSFGIIFYEMLSGVHPFIKPDVMATASSILQDEPAPLALHRDSISPVIQYLVRKMLAKQPAGRYQAVHEIHIDLLALSRNSSWRDIDDGGLGIEPVLEHGLGKGAAERSQRIFLLRVLPVLAALLLGLIIGALVIPRRGQSPRRVDRFAVSIAVTSVGFITLSPDGGTLIFEGKSEGVSQLYRRRMDSMGSVPIPGTKGGRGAFFSPEGKWVCFWSLSMGGRLVKVPIEGGDPQPLHAPLVTGGGQGRTALGLMATMGNWGPSDRIIFSDQNLWQVAAGGGVPESITTLDFDEQEIAHLWPEILPDGNAVLFTVSSRSKPDRIDVLSLETRRRHSLLEGSRVHYVANGILLYTRGSSLWAVSFDPQQLQVTGSEVLVMQDEIAVNDFSMAGGMLVYRAARELRKSQLMWVDRTGEEAPLSEEPRIYYQPRLSPDENRLAFINRSESGREDIYVLDLTRRSRTRVTVEGTSNRWPVWTPDGTRIAFTSVRQKTGIRNNLFWKAADGGGSAEELLLSEYSLIPHSWSPDGRTLSFYEVNPETGRDLWVLALEGEPSPFLVSPFDERSPVFSPDGEWIAYVSDESGPDEVYLMRYPDAGIRVPVSTDGGQEPAWSGDGGELFYRNEDQMLAVSMVTKPTLEIGQPTLLFEGRYDRDDAASGNPNYDVTADGQRFVMVKGVEGSDQRQIQVVTNWFEELKRLVSAGQ